MEIEFSVLLGISSVGILAITLLVHGFLLFISKSYYIKFCSSVWGKHAFNKKYEDSFSKEQRIKLGRYWMMISSILFGLVLAYFSLSIVLNFF